MDTQPPRDPSALAQTLSALQAEVSRMNRELADIKRLLVSEHPELTREQYTSYNDPVKHKIELSDTGNYMPATQEIPLRQPRPNLLKPGKKPQKKYKHHCKVCDGEWIGDEPAPPTCNYCRSRTWESGETKWALRRRNQDMGNATA